jgi:hypothetical protein
MALTHQGAILSIHDTPIDPTTPLDQTDFEALTPWLAIPGVVTAPSFEVQPNIITQNTLTDDIAQKQIGFREGADTEFVIAFSSLSNPAVAALETFAKSQNICALKYELNDSLGTNGTTFYGAFIVSGGGGVTGGGGEDFANRRSGLAMTHQYAVEVAAA